MLLDSVIVPDTLRLSNLVELSMFDYPKFEESLLWVMLMVEVDEVGQLHCFIARMLYKHIDDPLHL